MKFSTPSLQSLVQQFVGMLIRFPLALASAFLGTYAALMETRAPQQWHDPFWIKIMLCGNLGLVFGIAAGIFGETRAEKKTLKTLLNLGIGMLVTGYFFTLPSALLAGDWYRFVLLTGIGHLFVAVAPFYGQANIQEFWHYNKTLFLRFLTAALYASVLFAGICIALLAVDKLFSVDIDRVLYVRLWLFIAGIFNTCIFLAGVPENPLSLTRETPYPKGLKIFTQFVLIPLVSIYVIILLAYELKILFQWDLPQGWVANLIIAFAVFGILSLLLIFPVRRDAGNRWMTLYSRTFYWLMMPLVILLMIAIGTRIYQYGFTEERFWVAITGCWLFVIACYFLFFKAENIKIIPVSLIVTMLVTLIVVTPVCLHSQQHRLRRILNDNTLLTNGKIRQVVTSPSQKNRYEITSIIQYLYQVHGPSAVQPFFQADLHAFRPPMDSHVFTDSVLHTVGLTAVYHVPDSLHRQEFISLTHPSSDQVNATGYDCLVSGAQVGHQAQTTTWRLDHRILTCDTRQDGDQIKAVLWVNDHDSITVPLTPLFKKLIQRYVQEGQFTIHGDNVSVIRENKALRVKGMVTFLTGKLINGEPEPGSLVASVSFLIRFNTNTTP